MAQRLINKNIDIYNYPGEFEASLGSLTLGDLHGNPIKLIHFLFRHQIIKFKNEIPNRSEAYQEFVVLYEQYGEILQEYRENSTLLQMELVKISNAEERISSIGKQLLLECNKNSEQYNSLLLLLQQTIDKIKAAQSTKALLEQKLHEPRTRLIDLLDQFNQFMAKLDINDRQVLARLIGDEVADRGNCDYFTLRIFDFLRQSQSKMSILISNHGCEFIAAYEKLLMGQSFTPQGDIPDFQTPSILGLKLLMDFDLVTTNELSRLIDNSYKPNLKVLDYTLSETGITLFSHAPIRFDSIQLVAKRFGVTYDDRTKEALAKTIDQINYQFQFNIQENTVHSLFQNPLIVDKTNMSEQERDSWPLIYLIWNRWSDAKETAEARPSSHNGYDVSYVHGHDPFHSELAHIHNLDTLCGKESRKTEDKHITNSFEFIKKNQYTGVDKTAAEYYLRNLLRYKVLDSDEQQLPPENPQKHAPTVSSLEIEDNGSIKKLSQLGRPIPEKLSPVLTKDTPALVSSPLPAAPFTPLEDNSITPINLL